MLLNSKYLILSNRKESSFNTHFKILFGQVEICSRFNETLRKTFIKKTVVVLESSKQTDIVKESLN